MYIGNKIANVHSCFYKYYKFLFMEHIKRLDEMETLVQTQEEYPVYFMVKRFCYDREHKNGYWREEEMFDTIPECENYIKSHSYKERGETGRFGIYKTQLIKLVGEE